MYKIPVKIESALQVSVIVTGLTAMIVQLVFLRTFLGLLYGNELVIGVILCNWMLLTGIGAKLGATIKKPENTLIPIHLLTGLLPAMLVFGVLLLKSSFFPPGVLPSFTESLLLTFFAMAPFCVLSGAMFTLLSVTLSQHCLRNKTSQVYGTEALGSIFGSLLFTLLFIRIFSIPEILILVTSANLSVAILLTISFGKRKNTGHFILVGLLLWILFHLVFDWYGYARSTNFKGQQILTDKETAYGNLVVTKTGDQVNIFENGISGISSGEDISHEESVHYALLQLSDPEQVLVISGQVHGLYKEIKKYGNLCIDFVEVNPTLLDITDKYFEIPTDSNLHVHAIDPVTYLRKTNKKYDAILLNIPPPTSVQLNRFYTTEFFALLKARLSPNGVISLKPGGNSNYAGKEILDFYGVLLSTIKQVFSQVLIIPGETNYLLASDMPLSYKIAKRVSTLDLDNRYVNQYYLDDKLLEEKGIHLMDQIKKSNQLNTNFKPVAFYGQIRYWLSWYGSDLKWVAGVFVLIFGGFMLVMKFPGKAVFAAGFTATSIEIMAMITFQVMFGFLYEALAFLLAAFMAGLAAGTFLAEKYARKIPHHYFIVNQVCIGISAMLIPLLILFKPETWMPAICLGLIYLIPAISGLITGAQFSMANFIAVGTTGSRASNVYGADLAGSAGGAIITAVLLIPLAGFLHTGIILAALNLIVAIWSWFSGNKTR